MFRRSHLLPLSVLATVACGIREPRLTSFAEARPIQRAAIGCWNLYFLNGWPRGVVPSEMRVRLESTHLHDGQPSPWLRLVLESAPDSSEVKTLRLSGWSPVADRSAIYGFVGDGFTGIHFDVAVGTVTLRGKGSTFTDALPAISFRGDIKGERVPCEATGH
jgi:hypothetical protein